MYTGSTIVELGRSWFNLNSVPTRSPSLVPFLFRTQVLLTSSNKVGAKNKFCKSRSRLWFPVVHNRLYGSRRLHPALWSPPSTAGSMVSRRPMSVSWLPAAHSRFHGSRRPQPVLWPPAVHSRVHGSRRTKPVLLFPAVHSRIHSYPPSNVGFMVPYR